MRPGVLRRPDAFVLAWVSAYTAGLPAEVRDRRRGEVASDMWEHAREADTRGHGERSFRAHVLLRLLFGMPADVIWRMEQEWLAARKGRQEPRQRGLIMRASTATKGFHIVGGLLALFYVAFGFSVLFGLDRELDEPWTHAIPNFALAGAFALGVWLRRTRSRLGSVVMLLSVAPAGIGAWWTIATPLLAIAMLGLGFWALRGSTRVALLAPGTQLRDPRA